MIRRPNVRTMAPYDRWQNQNLYTVADALPDAAQGPAPSLLCFVHGTLNHLLWADQLWTRRLAGVARPAAVPIEQSPYLYADGDTLSRERSALDGASIEWANALEASWLEDNLSWYSSSAKRE